MKDLEILYPYQQVPISKWTRQFKSTEYEHAFIASKLHRDKKMAQYLGGIVTCILALVISCDPMVIHPMFWPEVALVWRGGLMLVCLVGISAINYIRTVKQLQCICWCFVVFLSVNIQTMTLLFDENYLLYVLFDVIILISLYFSTLFSFKSSCVIGISYCTVAVIFLFVDKAANLHEQVMVCAAYVSTNLAGVVISAHEHTFKRELYIRSKWLKSLVLEMKMQAYKDALTQLPNRRAFSTYYSRYQAQANRGNKKVYLAMADIDFFKRVNDTHGHDVGDEALVEFSRVLTNAIKSSDVLFRFGGEEFVLVLPRYARQEVEALFHKILLQLNENIFNIKEIDHPITASFGVTALMPNETSKEVLSRADVALYKAKENGRNQFIIEGAD